jgi:Putative sensor
MRKTLEAEFVGGGSAGPEPLSARGSYTTAVRDLVYLAATLLTSIVGFVVWLTGLTLTLSVLILVIGIFVWLGTVHVFRWTAGLDRALAGWRRGVPIPADYRPTEGPGILARIRSATVDPQTWKDLVWLVFNSIVGFIMTVAALSVTLLVLGYITMPLWWWAIPDPGEEYGVTNLGLFTVDSTATALSTTAIGLLLVPLVLFLNRRIVAAHSSLAATILGPEESPGD